MFQHDNIHITLPNGDTFSIASLNGLKEVAVLQNGTGNFVPVTEWRLGSDTHGDVLPVVDAVALSGALNNAIAWAEWDNARLMALALDQALS